MNHSEKTCFMSGGTAFCFSRIFSFCVLGWLILPLFLVCGFGAGKKTSANEEGRFGIYVDGKEIGEEKYSIQGSSNSYHSESVVAFKNPGPLSQDVKIETKLAMDENYMPQSYWVRSTIGRVIREHEGTFVPGQATFKYLVNGTPHQIGLLLDDYYVILDTNVFHHFIFVGRLVEFDNSVQSLDVVIPQEMDNGVLKIRDAGLEKIEVRGKKKELHHLRVDSGKLQVDLWVDDHRLLYKIALPAKNIEVIRKL
jgi:hypothetical protein